MSRRRKHSINNYAPEMAGLEARALLTTFAFLPQNDMNDNFQVEMPEMRSGHSALIGRNFISPQMSLSRDESGTNPGGHLDDLFHGQPPASAFGSIADLNKPVFRGPAPLFVKPDFFLIQTGNARPESEIEITIEISEHPVHSSNSLASIPDSSGNKMSGSSAGQTNDRTPDSVANKPGISIASNSFFSNAQSSALNPGSTRPSPAPTNASATSLARPLVLRRTPESLSNPGNTIESDTNVIRRSAGEFHFAQLLNLNTSPNKNVPASAVDDDGNTNSSGDFISTSISNQQWLQQAVIKSSDISISTDTSTGVIQITSGSQSLTTVQWPSRSIVHNELTNPEIISSDSVLEMAPELQLDAETLNSLMAEEITSGEMDLDAAIDELLSQLSDHEISISIDSHSLLSSASLLAVACVAIESYRRTQPVGAENPKEPKTSTQYMPEPVTSD